MSLRPWYNKDANYQTNAKSFMDYLARTNKFLEVLIEDYENFQELVTQELERIAFDSEMAVDEIFDNWLEDGTLERIINDEVLGNKADQDELRQIAITPESFGAKGDGVSDDTQAFKDAIAFGGENTRLVLSGGDYVIKEILTIEHDFFTIDGKGSRILYEGINEIKQSNGDHSVGIVQFKGKGLTATSQAIQQIENFRNETHSQYMTRVRVSNTASFNIGDYAIVNLNSGNHRTDFTDYKPQTTLLLPIADKTETDLFFNYTTPYDYERIGYTGEVTIANAIERPRVNDLTIVDRSQSPNDLTWTSALSFVFASNIHVENYQSFGFKNKGLRTSSAYRGKIKNCNFESPYTTDAGNGYGSQFVTSSFFDIENITGSKNRHLIDFSKSVNMKVRNSGSASSRSYDFDCHGGGEHDIEYTGCQGTFIFGNGSEFPSTTENVKIDKSTVHNIQGSFINNLTITNSRVERFSFGQNATNNVSIINSDLSDQPRNVYLNYNDRGGYFKKSRFEMIDSIFTPKNTTSTTGVNIYLLLGETEEITLKGNDMKPDDHEFFMIIQITGASERLLIENNLIYDTRIQLDVGTYGHVQFHNNTIKNKSSEGGFSVLDMVSPISSSPVFILSVMGNHFDAETPVNWLRLQTQVDLSPNRVFFQIYNNIFTGRVGENVGFTEQELVSSTRSSGGNLNFTEPEFETKLFSD